MLYSNKLDDFFDFLTEELGQDITDELQSKFMAWKPPQPDVKMTEIVINDCFGGFGVSKDVFDFFKKNKHPALLKEDKWEGYGWGRNMKRNDPLLVKAVKTLGKKANGAYAKLKIVKVPADIEWQIGEYDGTEWVEEVHREWH